nr:MAG TPA: hypothetical protein [Caudoviricetes sp.]
MHHLKTSQPFRFNLPLSLRHIPQCGLQECLAVIYV